MIIWQEALFVFSPQILLFYFEKNNLITYFLTWLIGVTLMNLTIGYRIYNLLPFVFSAFLCCFVQKKKTTIALLTIGLVISTGMNWYYPFPTFEKIKLSGKFEVGLRQFRLKDSGNLISVFYPAKHTEKRDFMNWIQFGETQRKALLKFRDQRAINNFFLNLLTIPILRLQIPCSQTAEILSSEEVGELLPIVFSHGLRSTSLFHSSTARELASNGAIVFSIDHMDGSASYTETEEGVGVPFDLSIGPFWKIDRAARAEIRKKEVVSLIDEIEQKSFIEKLGFDKQTFPKVAFDKLTMTGHSFGGATAVQVTSADPRVKACATLDMGTLPIYQKIESGEIFLKQPSTFLMTEGIMEYYQLNAKFNNSVYQHKLMLQSTSEILEFWYMRNSHHYMQTDFHIIAGLEMNLILLYLRFVGKTDLSPSFYDPMALSMSFNYKITHFLDQLGFWEGKVQREKLDGLLKITEDFHYLDYQWKEKEINPDLGLLPRHKVMKTEL